MRRADWARRTPRRDKRGRDGHYDEESHRGRLGRGSFAVRPNSRLARYRDVAKPPASRRTTPTATTRPASPTTISRIQCALGAQPTPDGDQRDEVQRDANEQRADDQGPHRREDRHEGGEIRDAEVGAETEERRDAHRAGEMLATGLRRHDRSP